MKDKFLIRLMMSAVAVICMSPLTAKAVVGKCSACHVMHASQLGSALPTTGPEGSLLNKTCLGCHGDGTDNASSAALIAGAAPQIYKAGGLSKPLAGGEFSYVPGNPRKGHNPYIATVIDQDPQYLASNPPGWVASYATDAGGSAGQQVPNAWAANKLSCSGAYGCHGNHDGASLPMHHDNSTGLATTIDGSTMGKSYRFLYGIAGGETTDYQFGAVNTNHNVYIGLARSQDSATGGTNTMSFFCAECHGIFHGGAATAGISSGALVTDTFGSPWLRHPVDFVMKVTGEYGKYGGGDGGGSAANATYNMAIPLATSVAARTTAANTEVVNTTDRIVMCLSCHYAHGGNNPASLRWDYTTTEIFAVPVDSTTGCFACHTAKDGVP